MKKISKQAMARLPYYLAYLKDKKSKGIDFVSASSIARDLKLNDVQVRKDLNSIATNHGSPHVGHNVKNLIKDLESYIDVNYEKRAVIIGTGSLGKALMSYDGLDSYGLNIVCGFDVNKNLIGSSINDRPIYDIKRLKEVIDNQNIDIAILTLPAYVAQDVCDILMETKIKAIWNYAPIKLRVKDDVYLHNENLASSLTIIYKHLKKEE